MEAIERRVDYGDLRKCGEITTLLSTGRKEFFLNCDLCDHSFLQLGDFIQHMCEDHFTSFIEINLKNVNTGILSSESENEKVFVEIDRKSEDYSEEEDDEHVYRDFEKVEIELEPSEMIISLDNEAEEISDEDTKKSFEDAVEAKSPEDIDNTGSEEELTLKQEDAQFDFPELEENKVAEKQARRKFIIEFIEQYRSLPALWNTNARAYRDRVLKKEQYQILLKKYKEQHPNATVADVKEKIQGLRTNFRRALKHKSYYGVSSLYYFDAMKFLSSITRVDETVPTVKPAPKKFVIQDSNLNDEQFIKLARIYQQYQCLWDEKDIAYRFANRRREALKKVLEEFNQAFGLNLTKNELEKEIARLRKVCSNEKKRKIACKRKKIDFKPSCPYYDDIAFLENDVTPFECPICEQLIFGPCQYKIHLSAHDGSLPFKCHICGHGFKLVTNLTVHLRRHAQDYTFNCEVCNKACATATELKTHSRLHTGEKPYVCDICGKAAGTVAEFRRHRDRHDNKPRHKCEMCSKAFFEKRKLKDHINAHLELRNYHCNVCNKSFTSSKLLRQHIFIHDAEKRYSCKICEKRFAQAAGLNSHMKSHGTKLSSKPLIEGNS